MLSRTASSLIRRQSARSFAKFEAASGSSVLCRVVNPASLSAVAPSTASFRVPTATQQRQFSDDSHGDFAPKKTKVSDGVDEAVEMVKDHVNSNPVMLYMKGNPSQPMCGFSAKIVQILQSEGIDFSSVNVLDYPSIREGVKKFAAWPTIPQLYVNGEFIGGTDIVSQMHESGELKELFVEAKATDTE